MCKPAPRPALDLNFSDAVYAPLEMPPAEPAAPEPGQRRLRLRRVFGAPAPARAIDPVRGQPFLGASRAAPVEVSVEVDDEPPGLTGPAALRLWSWRMGSPARAA